MKKINSKTRKIPINHIDKILSNVEKPARYIGGEINTTDKYIDKCLVSIALCYPDVYEIGMSNLAIKILYEIVNSNKMMIAERVFSPWVDMEEQLRINNIPLFSLESKTILQDFDVIGFSIGYELLYTNILTILDLSDIPFYSKNRDEDHPLIIAGGPAMANPEPLTHFMDLIVLGEGETLIIEILDKVKEFKEKGYPKRELLHQLSFYDGIYVPSEDNSYQSTTIGKKIGKFRHPDLNSNILPTKIPIPNIKPIQDRGVIEVSRGCTVGCRFCQAGMTNRPIRERSIDNIVNLAERLYEESGCYEITLMSLNIADYTNLPLLLEQLNNRLRDKGISFSLPSLKIDSFSFQIAKKLAEVKKFGLTLAVEAGNDKMRGVINKNYTQDKLLEFIEQASDYGWNTIKLYFMVGLPVEFEDITEEEAIVELLDKISQKASNRTNINANIGIFIPKAHTPFQWIKMIGIDKVYDKIKYIKGKVKSKRIHVKYIQPEISFLEGLLSLTGRNISKVLINAYEKGARFDGWQEMFSIKKWLDACNDLGYDFQEVLYKDKPKEYIFPWEHLDFKINKDYLYNEYEKSKKYLKTKDCRVKCYEYCGSCTKDIKMNVDDSEKKFDKSYMEEIYNKFYHNKEKIDKEKPNYLKKEAIGKLRLTYKKEGLAKFIGHLDLTYIFLKMVFIAKIPILFSKGYNPTPKLEFAPPLSVGIEGSEEIVEFKISDDVSTENIQKELNSHTPTGIKVIKAELISDNKSLGKKLKSFLYSIELKEKEYFSILIKKFRELYQLEYITLDNGKKKYNHIIDYNIYEKEYKLSVDIKHTQQANISINDILNYTLGKDKNKANLMKVARDKIKLSSS